MGRPKKEMRRIHSKRLKKARKKLKTLKANPSAFQDLPQLAKRVFRKRKKFQKSKR